MALVSAQRTHPGCSDVNTHARTFSNTDISPLVPNNTTHVQALSSPDANTTPSKTDIADAIASARITHVYLPLLHTATNPDLRTQVARTLHGHMWKREIRLILNADALASLYPFVPSSLYAIQLTQIRLGVINPVREAAARREEEPGPSALVAALFPALVLDLSERVKPIVCIGRRRFVYRDCRVRKEGEAKRRRKDSASTTLSSTPSTSSRSYGADSRGRDNDCGATRTRKSREEEARVDSPHTCPDDHVETWMRIEAGIRDAEGKCVDAMLRAFVRVVTTMTVDQRANAARDVLELGSEEKEARTVKTGEGPSSTGVESVGEEGWVFNLDL